MTRIVVTVNASKRARDDSPDTTHVADAVKDAIEEALDRYGFARREVSAMIVADDDPRVPLLPKVPREPLGVKCDHQGGDQYHCDGCCPDPRNCATHASRIVGLETIQLTYGGLVDGGSMDGKIHLVRKLTSGGTPGWTLCGIDRFDGYGFSVGGGMSDVRNPCEGCAAEAARMRLPVSGLNAKYIEQWIALHALEA